MGRPRKYNDKERHVNRYFDNARSRAKEYGIPFTITAEYLRSIATDECPVFKTPFEWGASGKGKGKFKDNSPQLDRIIPELGYVPENVAFISHRANRIKDNGTMQEHYDIADWIWSQTHAKKKSTTSIPKGFDIQGSVSAKSGTVPATRIRQDGNDTDYHCGAVYRVDIDHSPQKSGGDGVGQRGKEVGASKTPQSSEDNGDTKPKISIIKFGGRHLFS